MARKTFTEAPDVRLARAKRELGMTPDEDAEQRTRVAQRFLRPGRPTAGVRVVVDLADSDHDRLAAAAKRAGISVSEALRQILVQRTPRA
jgi:hypothetical protein